MQVAEEQIASKAKTPNRATSDCYHCGVPCFTASIHIDDKVFCCDGCKLVYGIINENGLCNYYELQSHPGLSQVKASRNEKYAFLDNEEIAEKLYHFTDGENTIVKFYIPGIHCSSCLWLLEHLNRLDSNIAASRVNFSDKEVTIHFARTKTGLRHIAELLTTIGYEPYISLNDEHKQAPKNYDRQRLYKLGVAGFCFGNIMMMSFPEYLSFMGIEQQFVHLFRYLNLLLAIPVFFYSASEFFVTAFKGIQQKTLNIDAPIALAIIITFSRSIYEIATNTGSGYLDSMSGIVFFMLAGRLLQERTYKSISFSRDYSSYFPIAVNVVTPSGIITRKLSQLKENDTVLLHSDEIIPADGIVLEGEALVDYSFVTGESEPVTVPSLSKVYAGGKQVGGLLKVQLVKPVAGSYLTSLWNHHAFARNKQESNDRNSSIHLLSKYFTWILLSLALLTAAYWYLNDPSKIISSVTAMLIVACPCALLLSSTFTNGNLLRILSNNGLFLRDATVIEQLGAVDHIVFDKTGTLTQGSQNRVQVTGHQLNDAEKSALFTLVRNSQHPYSKALANWAGRQPLSAISGFQETPGAGISATWGATCILVGSAKFTNANSDATIEEKGSVYFRIGEHITCFHFMPVFRSGIANIIESLKKQYSLSLLSGDNLRQQQSIAALFGSDSELLFGQSPLDKLKYIEQLQQWGSRVLMIGDGLNDAGALQQSNVGITMADDINNFTPGCDAILDASKFNQLPAVLRLARLSRYIVMASFIVSILYNIIGLYFAMQGAMRPVLAAILMPCSTLSIVLITSGASSLLARFSGLSTGAAAVK